MHNAKQNREVNVTYIYIKQTLSMLISQKRIKPVYSTDLRTRLVFPACSGQKRERRITVTKATLDYGVQMLLRNEKTTVLDDSDVKVTLQNDGDNIFTVRVACSTHYPEFTATVSPSSIHYDQQNLLAQSKQTSDARPQNPLANIAFHIHTQMLPLYSECVLKARDMQDCFGKITYPARQSRSLAESKKMSDSFMLDNSASIGMLTDMLNRKWHQNLSEALSSDGKTKNLSAYSVQYAARLLFLASVFCATAPPTKKSSLFHVSQSRMTEMPAGMPELMWSEIKPEKSGVSILLKGCSPEQRVMRCNLAVRKVGLSEKLATECMPSVMGMNASGSSTDILLVTGVANKIAAAIYVDSDTVEADSHKTAVAAFMASDSL